MTKYVIAFVIFSGIIYYYNVDLISLVDKSGIPTWLEEKGYKVRKDTATSTSATTSVVLP